MILIARIKSMLHLWAKKDEKVESHNEFWKVVEIDKGKAGLKCQRSFGHLSGQCHMNFVKKQNKLDCVGFSDDDRNPRP